MSKRVKIKHPESMETFKLYFRAVDHDNYTAFVKRTGKTPNIVWPHRWYDTDIDRAMFGYCGVLFGYQEFKHTDNLIDPFYWNDDQRQKISDILVDSDFHVDRVTTNLTIKGRYGVLPEGKPIPAVGTRYYDYCKTAKRIKLQYPDEAGKGVFLFVFNTDDCRYFAPINFTGSEYVFNNNDVISKASLQRLLRRVGNKLEPCFNEYLLFLVEAYIRQDFDTLYDYLYDGDCKDKDLIRYVNRWERRISKNIIKSVDRISKWDAAVHVMEWILDSIHFDTILDEPERYYEFVDLVRTGEIAGYISDIIWDRIVRVERTRRKELEAGGEAVI